VDRRRRSSKYARTIRKRYRAARSARWSSISNAATAGPKPFSAAAVLNVASQRTNKRESSDVGKISRKTKSIIRAAQRREDAQLARRKRQFSAALRRYGPRMFDHEVRALEMALAPAVGRIVMEQSK